MQGLMLVCITLFATALAFATNWLALIPWRRARNQHWTEQARLYHPVRTAAAVNLWGMPGVLTLAMPLLFSHELPHWTLTLMAAATGALLGTLPMDHEVFPRIQLRELWRNATVNWIVRFIMWFVFLGAIALMPLGFTAGSLVIAAVVLALCILWTYDGWVRVGRLLGLFLPPSERLQRIVSKAAARMNVKVSQVWVMRGPIAQAFAIPGSNRLLFSERLLEILSDDEVAAICTHELAHLTERRSDYLQRYIIWLVFLPWLFVRPMLHAFGIIGLFVLLFSSLLPPYLCRRLSQRLERRADDIAIANQPDAGTYARALSRLYEDSLLPAVHSKDHATHPHLYDRLLAAGATPDFPRPVPARSMAWHGQLLGGALGLVAVLRLWERF